MSNRTSDFADRLKKLREKHGYTQKMAASYINESRANIGAWEEGRGRPSFEVLPKIAELYGVTIGYLITGGESGEANHEEIQTIGSRYQVAEPWAKQAVNKILDLK